MIMSEKKKPAALIIASLKDGKESKAPVNEMGDVSDSSMAKESAADELLKAIESKDAKSIVEAFESMMELCNSEHESSESASEEVSE